MAKWKKCKPGPVRTRAEERKEWIEILSKYDSVRSKTTSKSTEHVSAIVGLSKAYRCLKQSQKIDNQRDLS